MGAAFKRPFLSTSRQALLDLRFQKRGSLLFDSDAGRLSGLTYRRRSSVANSTAESSSSLTYHLRVISFKMRKKEKDTIGYVQRGFVSPECLAIRAVAHRTEYEEVELTDPYATATLVKVGSVLHHVAVVKRKTIKRHVIRPTQAGRGWRPARTI